MSRITLKSPIENKTWLFAFLLALVALAYGIFEVWAEHDYPPEEERKQLADQALDEAYQNFEDQQKVFLSQSQDFTSLIVEIINSSDEDIQQAIEEAEDRYNFWGFSVFKDRELWVWSEFGPNQMPEGIFPESKNTYQPNIGLERNNNVTFLSFRSTLDMGKADSTDYHIFTRRKVEQKNILPIGDNSELSASRLFQSQSSYPVHFSFFEPPPEQPLNTRILSTQNSDSVGLAYTLSSDYQQYQEQQENQYFIYRAIFYALIIVLFTLFLLSVSQELTPWNSLFLKLAAIISAWLFFANIEYGVGWIQIFDFLNQSDYRSFQELITYSIHSFFIFLLALVSFKPLTSSEVQLKNYTLPVKITFYVIFGALGAFLFFFLLIETYTLLSEAPIPVLDLEVFPSTVTLIFYFASGLFGISASLVLILFGWFLVRQSSSITRSLVSMILGFSLATVLMFLMVPSFSKQDWIIYLGSIFFLIVLVFIFISHRDPTFFNNASRLRLLLLFSYFSVSLTYVAIYKGYSDKLNEQMNDAAQLFISEEESQAEQITQNLLTNLEQSLSGLTQNDLLERPDFVESLFIQQTQQHISAEWERFSISTQLVNNSGEIIGEYSSNLNSPAWTKAFNMFSLIIPFEAEQIRIQNLRPIIRERPLNEANTNYSSFRRGWIPLYERNNETRIGWILTSVYRERPQFEKPLRAVIASENSEDWNTTINITEYINGRSARTNILGPPLELPSNLRLPDELISKIQEDSTLYRVIHEADLNIREFFIANSDEQIIRAATSHPGFDNHLFSMIRFFFCVLGVGFILFGLLFWRKEFNIFGQSKRFRDRLIDRFILASLFCLMALMTTTYYAISSQTQKSIQDQLLNKLSNLTEAITLYESESNESSEIPLSQLTSTLDADAALYRNQVLALSTTTQIYSQHLLPRLLPWDVYNSIMERGNRQVTRIITLGDLQLLIGYQPWLNEENEIAGIVAIPTFLNAPKFNEQLLSTTSYLLGLYVIIFGLFILGAALISTQLTSPLEALRDGLKKITGGDLETTLPVRSKDEIGSLTNAYNVMVYRLKDLQDELARAEREAAWKEMAQQVAHEIKNPLTPMKLNLQHLERQLKASKEDFAEMKPKIEKIAANMIEQIESLNQIASDFSKFAKPTEQEFKEVEVNELVRAIADLYEPEQRLTVKTNLYKRKLWISGVKDELRRVLINLVKNAHEAMPKGGTVTLVTSLQKEMVSISIKDNGEGIPKESRDHIFVPNFSTKSSGTGLGLAITKKIIQEHNGEISFTSVSGEGTTFIIHLPLLKK